MSLYDRIRQHHNEDKGAGEGSRYNNGHQTCCVCNKEFSLGQLEMCVWCDKWVCTRHVKYKDDGMGKDIPCCPSCAHKTKGFYKQ